MTTTPTSGASDTERVVYQMRTHPKVLFMPIVAAFACLLAAIACVRFVPDDTVAGPWGMTLALSACGLAFLVFTVIPMLRWQFCTFTLTTRWIRTRSGLLNRTGSDIPISKITTVDTERGILDRIFRCGTLIVQQAASDGKGTRLRDIPRAEQVRSTINDMVYEASIGGQQPGR